MKKLLLTLAAALLAAPLFAQMPRSEVSVSYGYAPTTTWIDAYGDILLDFIGGTDSKLTDWGAVSFGYNFRLTEGFSIGVQAVYSTTKSEYFHNDLSAGSVENRYWSVMPNIKKNWFSAGVVSLYTRIAAGVAFRKASSGGESETESHFAFQFSPVGVEVGGNLAAYAEVGIGMSGCLIAGARYRF